jgi:hypothetical protein
LRDVDPVFPNVKAPGQDHFLTFITSPMPEPAALRNPSVLLDTPESELPGWGLGVELLDDFCRFGGVAFGVGLPPKEERERRYLGRDDGYKAAEFCEESMTYGGDRRIGIVFGGNLSTKDERRGDSDGLSGWRANPIRSSMEIVSNDQTKHTQVCAKFIDTLKVPVPSPRCEEAFQMRFQGSGLTVSQYGGACPM